jgi:hypothetical protein
MNASAVVSAMRSSKSICASTRGTSASMRLRRGFVRLLDRTAHGLADLGRPSRLEG